MALDTKVTTLFEEKNINLLVQKAITLLEIDIIGQLWHGTQYTVPYDTAHVAGIKRNNRPLFPKTITWLIQDL